MIANFSLCAKPVLLTVPLPPLGSDRLSLQGFPCARLSFGHWANRQIQPAARPAFLEFRLVSLRVCRDATVPFTSSIVVVITVPIRGHNGPSANLGPRALTARGAHGGEVMKPALA